MGRTQGPLTLETKLAYSENFSDSVVFGSYQAYGGFEYYVYDPELYSVEVEIESIGSIESQVDPESFIGGSWLEEIDLNLVDSGERNVDFPLINIVRIAGGQQLIDQLGEDGLAYFVFAVIAIVTAAAAVMFIGPTAAIAGIVAVMLVGIGIDAFPLRLGGYTILGCAAVYFGSRLGRSGSL